MKSIDAVSKMVTYRHTSIRRAMLPLFSLYEVVVLAILECLGRWLAYRIVPAHVPEVMCYGYIGWVLVAFPTTTASLRLPLWCEGQLVEYLRKFGFVQKSPEALSWIPPIPRLLRWPRNRIDASIIGDDLLVSGPANYLRMISAHFKSKPE